jgi:hypothetical protein
MDAEKLLVIGLYMICFFVFFQRFGLPVLFRFPRLFYLHFGNLSLCFAKIKVGKMSEAARTLCEMPNRINKFKM